MAWFERDGEAFERRYEGDEAADSPEPKQWHDEHTRLQWREVFLSGLKGRNDDVEHGVDCFCQEKCKDNPTRAQECFRECIGAFSDAINTGFYVNSYTTKQCPTMEGVLENLRQGLERLEEQRKVEKESLETKRAEVESTSDRIFNPKPSCNKFD